MLVIRTDLNVVFDNIKKLLQREKDKQSTLLSESMGGKILILKKCIQVRTSYMP